MVTIKVSDEYSSTSPQLDKPLNCNAARPQFRKILSPAEIQNNAQYHSGASDHEKGRDLVKADFTSSSENSVDPLFDWDPTETRSNTHQAATMKGSQTERDPFGCLIRSTTPVQSPPSVSANPFLASRRSQPLQTQSQRFNAPRPSTSPQDYARNYSTIHTLTQERTELYCERDRARQEVDEQKRLKVEIERKKNLEIRALNGRLYESDARIKELEQEGKKKDRKIKALEAEAKKRKLEDEIVSTKKINLFLELEVKVKGSQIEGVVVNEE